MPLPTLQPKSTETLQLSAPVQEVFSSIQGEGPYVGSRQIFVRFAHCHLKCAYCDTPMSQPSGECHIETMPGSGQWEQLSNPLSIEALEPYLATLSQQAPHHSISATGGEPLLYHRFLAELFPVIQSLGLRTYLETSGTQPDFLASVLSSTDIIAMDIKLPSATKEDALWLEHQAFYQLARSNSKAELFVKLVFNEETTIEELEPLLTILSNRTTPIYLQPEMPLDGGLTPNVRSKTMLHLQGWLAQQFETVRLVPQTHKLLGIS